MERLAREEEVGRVAVELGTLAAGEGILDRQFMESELVRERNQLVV